MKFSPGVFCRRYCWRAASLALRQRPAKRDSSHIDLPSSKSVQEPSSASRSAPTAFLRRLR